MTQKSLKRIYRYVNRELKKRGYRHLCYVCKHTLGRFYPYRKGVAGQSPLTKMFQIVGSDIENFRCPWCGCFDRERHLLMYFDKLGIWNKIKGHVLHIAPEEHLAKRIGSLESLDEYVKGDLSPKSETFKKIDVTEIPFPDEYFDFILCNHVLEHIPDVEKGMQELFRVLKRGGYAVLQTPYSKLLAATFMDSNINTPSLRKAFYGQEDHVRVFGNDFFSRLESAGFELHISKHGIILADFDSRYYGINPEEPLILVSRS